MQGGKAISTRRAQVWTCLLLAALVAAVYWQTRHFEFVSFDDGLYVFDNSHVTAGLNRGSVAWSLSFDDKSKTYWHPLTWLSHMLDVELFGLDAGAHHLTNAALHLANAILLFFVLTRMTGAWVPSALTAALFAVHPINVESVAWVAERKNVLSTAFWLLTTLLYVGYTRRPGMRRYSLLLVVFTLGLLAKPMLVTLPCTLLLLDFWPLGRLKLGRAPLGTRGLGPQAPEAQPPARVRDLILEKIPMLFLSLLAAYLAMGSLRNTDVTVSFEAIPLAVRLENALVSYVIYMVKAVWPSDLAMFYPYQLLLPLWKTGLAVLVLGAVTVAALRMTRTRPYVIVGWLWFLGTLVPVSGILQAGLWPAWADRWAYIPYIGLFVISVWGARDLARKHGTAGRACAAALAAVALGALTVAGHRQASVWENSISLYRHAVKAVPDNFVAYNNLGSDYYSHQRLDEAVAAYHESSRVNPFFPYPYYNLGRYHLDQGRLEEAEHFLEKALSLDPHLAAAHTFLGEVMQKKGDVENAFYHYQQALKNNPVDKKAFNDMGVILLQIGKPEGAIKSLQEALRIDPAFSEAHNNLGYAYLRSGRPGMAAEHLEKALALDPGNQLARENLKEALLARQGN